MPLILRFINTIKVCFKKWIIITLKFKDFQEIAIVCISNSLRITSECQSSGPKKQSYIKHMPPKLFPNLAFTFFLFFQMLTNCTSTSKILFIASPFQIALFLWIAALVFRCSDCHFISVKYHVVEANEGRVEGAWLKNSRQWKQNKARLLSLQTNLSLFTDSLMLDPSPSGAQDTCLPAPSNRSCRQVSELTETETVGRQTTFFVNH